MPRETLAAVSITDVHGLKKAWESTPPGQAWKDPQLSALVEPVERRLKEIPREFSEKWGVSTDEIESVVTGGVALFLTHLDWPKPDIYEFDLCFLAEIRPENQDRVRALVEKMLEKTPVDSQRSRYAFKGETVYVIRFVQEIEKPPPAVDPRTGKTTEHTPAPDSSMALVEQIPILIQYSILGSYLVVCEGRNEPIRKIITALKDPAERLGQEEGYRKIEATMGAEGAVSAWMMAGRYWKILTDHRKQTKGNPDLSSLGLQDVGGVLGRVGLGADALTLDLAVDLPKTPKGALALLVQPGEANDLRSASLCPPGVLSYSSFLVDWGKMWALIRLLLTQFAPQAWGFLNLQVSQFSREFAIDVERGVLGAMGGEVAFYRRHPPSLQGRLRPEEEVGSMTLLVGLRDGKTFRQNHERMFQVLTAEPYQLPLKKSTYLTYDIFQFKQDPGSYGLTVPAWTVTDGFLVVSSDSEELPGFLRAWTGKAEKTLADEADFKRALAVFPSQGRMGFSYTPASSLPDMFGPLVPFLSMPFGDLERRSSGQEALDPAVKETLSRHIGSLSGASYILPGVFHTHSRLSAPKQ